MYHLICQNNANNVLVGDRNNTRTSTICLIDEIILELTIETNLKSIQARYVYCKFPKRLQTNVIAASSQHFHKIVIFTTVSA